MWDVVEQALRGVGDFCTARTANRASMCLFIAISTCPPVAPSVVGLLGVCQIMAFILMIFVGTGNRIFMKLQTYPMYNYPFFLTMLSTFIYVPVCFMYIVPMLAFG